MSTYIPSRVIGSLNALLALLFLRLAADSFDLPKATLLWFFTPLLLWFSFDRIREQRFKFLIEQKLIVAFLVALVVSLAFSIDPVVSFWGQAQRYTGFLTLLAAACIFLISSHAKSSDDYCFNLKLFIGTLALIVLYVFLQDASLDPFQWTAVSFGKLVFGTLGNPNTTAAMVAALLPYPVFLLVSDDSKRWVRVLSIGLITGAIYALGALGALQGPLAGSAIAVLMGFFCLSKRTMYAFFLSSATVLAGIVVPFLDLGPASYVVLLVVLSTAWFIYWEKIDDKVKSRQRGNGRKRLLGVIGCALLVLTSTPLWFGRIQSELSASFTERGDFYRAATKSFFHSPLFGSGPETFGFIFTRFRSAGHAQTLEDSRTSSVHSVFLGMFSNGGLFVGLLFASFCIFVTFLGIKGLRTSSGKERLWIATLFSSWVAFLLQSLVSVEHVSLLVAEFFVAGLVVGASRSAVVRANSSKTSNEIRSKRTRAHQRSETSRSRVARNGGYLAVLVCIVLAPVTTRYYRASISSFEGSKELYSTGDLSKARMRFEAASNLAPWDGMFISLLAEVEMRMEMSSEARSSLVMAAEANHYSGAITPSIAVALVNLGFPADALDVAAGTLEADPLAPTVRDSVRQVFEFVKDQDVFDDEVRQRATQLLAEM